MLFMNRKRLFEIIEVAERGDRASMAYDFVMIAAIIVSLIPLTTKTYHDVFYITDRSRWSFSSSITS